MKLKKWTNNQVLEFWKNIEEYEGLYMISSLGRVKSLNYKRTGKVKIMKPQLNNEGYLRVTLFKEGKKKRFLIHRLVAIAFIPNPLNKPYIDHIDTNSSNNNVKNLRWVTQKENCNNQLSIKKYSKAKKGKHHSEETKKKMSEAQKGENNPKARKVRCIETGEIFNTLTEASEWGGSHRSNIAKQIQGKQKSAGKQPITNIPLHWEYVD